LRNRREGGGFEGTEPVLELFAVLEGKLGKGLGMTMYSRRTAAAFGVEILPYGQNDIAIAGKISVTSMISMPLIIA
jgi:hypothetical protein